MFAKNLEINFAAFLDNANSILVAKIHIFLLRFFFPDEFPILMKSSRDAKSPDFCGWYPHRIAAGIRIWLMKFQLCPICRRNSHFETFWSPIINPY